MREQIDSIEWRIMDEETPVETEIEGTRFRVERVKDAVPASHPWRLLEHVGDDEWTDGGYVFETRESACSYLEDFMREEGVLR